MCELAFQAAAGMAYLADQNKFHRDLAARNCLLDLTHTHLKVSDFGLLLEHNSDYEKILKGSDKNKETCFPVRWMSPEFLECNVYTQYCDVWSYGVLLWEIAMKGKQPYEGYTNEQAYKQIKSRIVLSTPTYSDAKELDKIMKLCWQAEPEKRPTFSKIVDMLYKKTSEKFQIFFKEKCPYDFELHDVDEGRGSLDASTDDADPGIFMSLTSPRRESFINTTREEGYLNMSRASHHCIDLVTRYNSNLCVNSDDEYVTPTPTEKLSIPIEC